MQILKLYAKAFAVSWILVSQVFLPGIVYASKNSQNIVSGNSLSSQSNINQQVANSNSGEPFKIDLGKISDKLRLRALGKWLGWGATGFLATSAIWLSSTTQAISQEVIEAKKGEDTEEVKPFVTTDHSVRTKAYWLDYMGENRVLKFIGDEAPIGNDSVFSNLTTKASQEAIEIKAHIGTIVTNRESTEPFKFQYQIKLSDGKFQIIPEEMIPFTSSQTLYIGVLDQDFYEKTRDSGLVEAKEEYLPLMIISKNDWKELGFKSELDYIEHIKDALAWYNDHKIEIKTPEYQNKQLRNIALLAAAIGVGYLTKWGLLKQSSKQAQERNTQIKNIMEGNAKVIDLQSNQWWAKMYGQHIPNALNTVFWTVAIWASMQVGSGVPALKSNDFFNLMHNLVEIGSVSIAGSTALKFAAGKATAMAVEQRKKAERESNVKGAVQMKSEAVSGIVHKLSLPMIFASLAVSSTPILPSLIFAASIFGGGSLFAGYLLLSKQLGNIEFLHEIKTLILSQLLEIGQVGGIPGQIGFFTAVEGPYAVFRSLDKEFRVKLSALVNANTIENLNVGSGSLNFPQYGIGSDMKQADALLKFAVLKALYEKRDDLPKEKMGKDFWQKINDRIIELGWIDESISAGLAKGDDENQANKTPLDYVTEARHLNMETLVASIARGDWDAMFYDAESLNEGSSDENHMNLRRIIPLFEYSGINKQFMHEYILKVETTVLGFGVARSINKWSSIFWSTGDIALEPTTRIQNISEDRIAELMEKWEAAREGYVETKSYSSDFYASMMKVMLFGFMRLLNDPVLSENEEFQDAAKEVMETIAEDNPDVTVVEQK